MAIIVFTLSLFAGPPQVGSVVSSFPFVWLCVWAVLFIPNTSERGHNDGVLLRERERKNFSIDTQFYMCQLSAEAHKFSASINGICSAYRGIFMAQQQCQRLRLLFFGFYYFVSFWDFFICSFVQFISNRFLSFVAFRYHDVLHFAFTHHNHTIEFVVLAILCLLGVVARVVCRATPNYVFSSTKSFFLCVAKIIWRKNELNLF